MSSKTPSTTAEVGLFPTPRSFRLPKRRKRLPEACRRSSGRGARPRRSGRRGRCCCRSSALGAARRRRLVWLSLLDRRPVPDLDRRRLCPGRHVLRLAEDHRLCGPGQRRREPAGQGRRPAGDDRRWRLRIARRRRPKRRSPCRPRRSSASRRRPRRAQASLHRRRRRRSPKARRRQCHARPAARRAAAQTKVATQAQVDDAHTALDQANAALVGADAQIAGAQANIGVFEAQRAESASTLASLAEPRQGRARFVLHRAQGAL